jgi:para-nitrobenzyl esterase
LQRAEAEGVKLQQALGAKDIDELRTFGGDRVLRKAEELDISLWPPVLDGYVSVARPADIFAAGKQNDVPLLISTTANDASNGNPFTETHTVPEYLTAAAKVFGPNAPEFLKLFPVKVDSDVDRQASLITSQSGWMAQGAREWAAQQIKAGKSPSYVLLFDHPQPYSAVLPIEGVDPRRPVARHTDDIVYWLGTLDLLNELRTTRVWKDYDRKLSGELQEVVVNFASSGIPKSSSFTLPAFNPADQKLAYVGENYLTVRKISVPQMDFLRDHPIPDSYVALPQRPSE